MPEQNHLEQNVERLLQLPKTPLALPEEAKRKILRSLLEESRCSGRRSFLSIPRRAKRTLLAASAAALTAAASLLVVFLSWPAKPAYAIEDTIQALRRVSTVHVKGTTWQGRPFESWQKVDPQTGKVDHICIDERPFGLKVATTPRGSRIWNAEGQIVETSNRIVATNDLRYEDAFVELSEKMARGGDGESIHIYHEKSDGRGEEIVIQVASKLQDFKIYIDPATKLPIRMLFDRADNMQQICKSQDHIEYNTPLPDGMFDFEVPAQDVRDYNALDDPANGLAVGEMSREEASKAIVEKYWHAAIAADWDTVRRLAPMDESWKSGFKTNHPIELVRVDWPYAERGCSGLIVPCVVRFEDGRVLDIRPVVNYRQSSGPPSTIIVAFWDKAKPVVPTTQETP